MNKKFPLGQGVKVPDGTIVFPFLNPKDSFSDLPWDVLEAFSLSAGEITQGEKSKIHILLHVTQVTFVLEGTIEICMKDATSPQPYTLSLNPYEAVLTKPGTFFQLINAQQCPCKVLYIVSPAYVYELDDDMNVRYDDAISLDETWEDLASINWAPRQLINPKNSIHSRNEAYQRLAQAKQVLK